MSAAQTPAPLDPDEYLADCFRLAKKIWDDGYRPDFLVALWRGGTPPGIAIHELFRCQGHDFYHTAIRTQSLEGVGQGNGYDIRGLKHVIDDVESVHQMLIVDDLFDSGRTMYEVIEYLRRRARRNTPQIRVAAVYYRPEHRAFVVGPHYYLHSVSERPVFPHQLTALAPERLAETDAELYQAIWGEAPAEPVVPGDSR